ncbi:monovalent cation/H+ antiporter complex subunit F [Microbacterium sp. gxy059]|uniref:monovalent cation/H+ antiporter complex subunit F n=1 Tax=Microbacterium sp. gxy059 TaxID=2957199 RepID=UPI003D99F3E2
MTVQNVLIAIIVALFAVAAVLTLIRMVKGPSILDRAVASDVLLTEVLCVMGAEAVINQRTDTLPVMLMIAATGILGTVAVARFVARRDQRRDER